MAVRTRSKLWHCWSVMEHVGLLLCVSRAIR